MMVAADLFCGAGGSSTGLVRAAARRGIALDLLAVNHWPVAVATHSENHPWARHLCADLSAVDPNKVVTGGRLDLLIASPECTHHSIARGGKPCSDQSRASAWHVLHWVERLRVDHVIVENVREFAEWGPLGENGRPDKKRKGETFQAFVAALRSFGYTVEWRVLNAADYGDATCRRRLFLQAARDSVTWPQPSHVGRWKPARDIIDWELKGELISQRRRPLAPKTLDRIEAGLRRFGGEPFIAVLRGTHVNQASAWAKPLSAPLGTISAGGVHAALCVPFLVEYHGAKRAGDQRIASVDAPLPTQTTENRFGLCEPFLTKYYSKGTGAKSVTEPLATITTRDRLALVEPTGMDIRFRMLQPHELAAAMGFEDYRFCGTKTDQVRQIGNAVAVRTAEALCGTIMDGN